MMTFGSFVKWDPWKCLVVRNPSRKNALFSFGKGKQKSTLNPLMNFRHAYHCWKNLWEMNKPYFPHCRLIFMSRILVFVPEACFLGGWATEARPPGHLDKPSLIGYGLTIPGKETKNTAAGTSETLFYSFCSCNCSCLELLSLLEGLLDVNIRMFLSQNAAISPDADVAVGNHRAKLRLCLCSPCVRKSVTETYVKPNFSFLSGLQEKLR